MFPQQLSNHRGVNCRRSGDLGWWWCFKAPSTLLCVVGSQGSALTESRNNLKRQNIKQRFQISFAYIFKTDWNEKKRFCIFAVPIFAETKQEPTSPAPHPLQILDLLCRLKQLRSSKFFDISVHRWDLCRSSSSDCEICNKEKRFVEIY